ncbi:MAG: hypothetical protein C4518_15350 [Desulfobacteraceae bacterium]|nr:MAG: hypothetical protein C4518_15350 [Desulfobacteraceae bacterium]
MPKYRYFNYGFILLFILVAVSTGLRFTNLNGKIYWHDEAYTSLRVFGHTSSQYYTDIFDNKIHTIKEVRAYQYPNPDLGITDTIKALVSRPEHPPLYYLVGRLWSGMFVDPVFALRSLSVLFGILLLPAVYLLMRELFDDPWVSWTAVAIAAVSPLHLLYSQEARQYGLWTTLTALSCAFFLRGLRTHTSRSWYAYTLTIILGFYTHIMFAFAVITHIVYLILMRAQIQQERIKAFACSVALGITAFIPWFVLLIYSRQDVLQKTGWMKHPLPKLTLAHNWLLSINRLFIDFPGSAYLIPISAALVIFSLIILVRRNPRRVWLLPVLLLTITGGIVILPDILGGGMRSFLIRYLFPPLLSIELCVAYMIGSGIKYRSPQAPLMRFLAVLLIAGGLFSQVMIVSSDKWWNKYQSEMNGDAAAIINASDKPLLISMMGDINPGEVLSMSYHLDDHVELLLLNYNSFPEIPSGFDRIFVLNPAWELLEGLKKKYTMNLIHKPEALWELVKEVN